MNSKEPSCCSSVFNRAKCNRSPRVRDFDSHLHAGAASRRRFAQQEPMEVICQSVESLAAQSLAGFCGGFSSERWVFGRGGVGGLGGGVGWLFGGGGGWGGLGVGVGVGVGWVVWGGEGDLVASVISNPVKGQVLNAKGHGAVSFEASPSLSCSVTLAKKGNPFLGRPNF